MTLIILINTPWCCSVTASVIDIAEGLSTTIPWILPQLLGPVETVKAFMRARKAIEEDVVQNPEHIDEVDMEITLAEWIELKADAEEEEEEEGSSSDEEEEDEFEEFVEDEEEDGGEGAQQGGGGNQDEVGEGDGEGDEGAPPADPEDHGEEPSAKRRKT